MTRRLIERLMLAGGAALLAGCDGAKPAPNGAGSASDDPAAARAKAAANLRGLAEGMVQWDPESDGPFEGFPSLAAKGYVKPETLHSPHDPVADRVSYVLLPPLSSTTTSVAPSPDQMLAYEILCHPDGTNVLYLDGHVSWMALADFLAAYEQHFATAGRVAEPPRGCE